jgi:hypothetical protein
MGALASAYLGGGGGSSINPSSSASAGPQSGTTGNLVLNFGGINLGNQDIPVNAQSETATNQTPVVGTHPASVLGVATASGGTDWTPILVIGAIFGLLLWWKR